MVLLQLMPMTREPITIECASDTKEPYTMNSKVYATLVKLCVDICKRNGKKKLLWFSDKRQGTELCAEV
jgi:hypothetical protein